MDMRLNRIRSGPNGIFSVLDSKDDQFSAFTLEHAYPCHEVRNDETADLGISWNGYAPKIPNGKYLCVRGLHRLESMIHQFETFEVTGIKDHKNILFHVGNYQRDTSGCILVGQAIAQTEGGGEMITNSRKVFDEFMLIQKSAETFYLTVT